MSEWYRAVMAARGGRAGRARRSWHPDDPPPVDPADEASPHESSWFASSLALAQGLLVIEHAQGCPDLEDVRAAVDAAPPSAIPSWAPTADAGASGTVSDTAQPLFSDPGPDPG